MTRAFPLQSPSHLILNSASSILNSAKASCHRSREQIRKELDAAMRCCCWVAPRWARVAWGAAAAVGRRRGALVDGRLHWRRLRLGQPAAGVAHGADAADRGADRGVAAHRAMALPQRGIRAASGGVPESKSKMYGCVKSWGETSRAIEHFSNFRATACSDGSCICPCWTLEEEATPERSSMCSFMVETVSICSISQAHPLDLLQSALTGTPVTVGPAGPGSGCPVAVSPAGGCPVAPASFLTASGGMRLAAVPPLGLPNVISSGGPTPAGPRCGRVTPASQG